MQVLFKNIQSIACQDGERLIIRNRPLFLLSLLGGSFGFGLVLFWLAQVDFAEFGVLWRGAAWLICVLSASALLIVWVRGDFRPTVLDPYDYSLRHRRWRIPLADVESIDLVRDEVASLSILSVVARVRSKKLVLLTDAGGKHGAALEELVQHARVLLGGLGGKDRTAQQGRSVSIKDNVVGRGAFATVAIAIGALWAGLMYFFAPWIIIGDAETGGLLAWPFGLWIMGAGLCELVGIRVFGWILEGPFWRKALVALIWAGSYVTACLLVPGWHHKGLL